MTSEQFMDRVRSRDPHEPEFHQAVQEVIDSLWPYLEGDGQREMVIAGKDSGLSTK